MSSFATLVLAASAVLGQRGEAKEVNEHLKELRWLNNIWHDLDGGSQLFFTWSANNQIMRQEFRITKVPGIPDFSGVAIVYWDAADQKVKMFAATSTGAHSQCVAETIEPGKVVWAVNEVDGQGAAHKHTLTMSHDGAKLAITFKLEDGTEGVLKCIPRPR